MVKFYVEKKAMGEAAIMLAQVSALKSIGAPPSESSSIYLTPTTMTLINSNEANSIMVENIPLTILDGEVNEHIEQAYLINTKKFASIVKGCKSRVNFIITESNIAIGEGNRKYELAVYSAAKKDLPAMSLFDYKVDIKEVLKNLVDTDLITAQSVNITELAGTLFTGNNMAASDRLSALYIENGGMLAGAPDNIADIIITTDLFAACLSKTKEENAVIGFTDDKQSVVMKLGNITLAKRLLTSKFPKKQILASVNNIKKGIEKGGLKATISLKEFMDKLHEVREIVEADDYIIKFKRDGTLSIENSNVKSGAEGMVVIDATVTMSQEAGDEIGSKFAYIHLDMLGKLFSGEDNVELHSSMGAVDGVQVLRYLAVKTDGKVFFCTPKT